MKVAHAAAAALTLLLVTATPASADWLITPFIGSTFASKTPFFDFEQSAGATKVSLGGSGAWLSDGVFGAEADFGYSPRFFERNNRAGLVSDSNVTTLVGNAIAALPLGVTHESLRPYVVGGIGLIHAAAADLIDLFSVDGNLLGYDVGGGAIGMFDPNIGVRFDVRQFRTVHDFEHPLQDQRAHLSFWRATVGVTIRY